MEEAFRASATLWFSRSDGTSLLFLGSSEPNLEVTRPVLRAVIACRHS